MVIVAVLELPAGTRSTAACTVRTVPEPSAATVMATAASAPETPARAPATVARPARVDASSLRWIMISSCQGEAEAEGPAPSRREAGRSPGQSERRPAPALAVTVAFTLPAASGVYAYGMDLTLPPAWPAPEPTSRLPRATRVPGPDEASPRWYGSETPSKELFSTSTPAPSVEPTPYPLLLR